jgi:poly-gamma-glutamate synthesis protein (capsule biosynthesis protein)
LFVEIKPAIEAADYAIANLETPVAPNKNGPTMEKVFNAPLALLKALENSGFDAVSIANNHVWDQGKTGMLETIGHLKQSKLAWAGAGTSCSEARSYRLVQVGSFKVGWVSSTRIHNLHLNTTEEAPCVFDLDIAKALEQAQKAREAGAELVFLSLHWGVEYRTKPESWDKKIAKDLLEGGFDGILGHHPHVLQPLEFHQTKDGRKSFVMYSMGNFISSQAWGYVVGSNSAYGIRRDGALLRVKLERVAGKAVIEGATVDPLWTEHGAVGCLDTGVARARPIRLLPALQAAKLDAALSRCVTHYEQRLAYIRQVVGAEHVLDQ